MFKQHIDEQTEILIPKGALDVYTYPLLRMRIIELVQGATPHMLIDLTDVNYLDCPALGVLIDGLRRQREAGGTLEIICPNPKIRRVFEVAGIDWIFEIHEVNPFTAREVNISPAQEDSTNDTSNE